MKELLYLNKYFVKYKYSFHWVLYYNYRANFHAFHAKLISDSFKAIEAFSENKDIAASVIREELIRNIHY
jgi:ATP-binding cassette subfamily B protein